MRANVDLAVKGHGMTSMQEEKQARATASTWTRFVFDVDLIA
jgi:hypothetical protein